MERYAIAAAALAAAFAATPAQSAEANGPLLAQACAGCHGPSEVGAGGPPEGVIDIRGYDRADFLRTWEEFRMDGRPATIMNRIARGYTDAEIAALADYFASLE
ncbi:MAG: c-type cytochrome [Alkalilacustris sp.]